MPGQLEHAWSRGASVLRLSVVDGAGPLSTLRIKVRGAWAMAMRVQRGEFAATLLAHTL